MRIVLAEDQTLLREGLCGLLTGAGHEIVDAVGDADALRQAVLRASAEGNLPELVLTDVRMPPGQRDDGIQVALELRGRFPGLPVMVLSAYVAGPYVAALLDGSGDGGVGYLLKERVGRVDDFLRQLAVVAGGGIVVDPEVVHHLMHHGAPPGLARLSEREREVMELMAEGLSNQQICGRLYLSAAAVGKHVANIFAKLDLPPGEENRRVRAVLTWLRATSPDGV